MAITRIISPDKGFGAKLTSAEINDIDENVTNALDKRAGETDDLESVVTCLDAGRIVCSGVVGANADTTYTVADGIGIIELTFALSANRIYTLSATGAQTYDVVHVVDRGAAYTVQVKDGVSSQTLATVGPETAGTAVPVASFYFDGTNWRLLVGKRGKQFSQTFTSNGTWTSPANITQVLLLGWGGGGAGGGGAGGENAVTNRSAGGAGGGAARSRLVRYAVAGATGYSVVIGNGGTSASPGAPSTGAVSAGNKGQDGANTTFDVDAIFPGGQGGSGGYGPNAADCAVLGGAPTNLAPTGGLGTPLATSTVPLLYSKVPGGGGAGLGSAAIQGLAGTGSEEGYAGGAGASYGTPSGSYQPGGGGGGGGGGPGGVGGAAGAGGNANAAGTGANGANGTAGAANTGAGGGGGGGGGAGSVAGGSGGYGGGGGSGQLTVIWFL